LSTGNGNKNYIINSADLLIGFNDVDGDRLNVVNLAVSPGDQLIALNPKTVTSNSGVLTNNNNGTFTFTPSRNFNGVVNLTYDVTDGKGGTIVGQTYSFNIVEANDAPILTHALANLTAVNEDAGAPKGAVGNLISTLVGLSGSSITNLSLANNLSTNVTDLDAGAVTGVAITATDSTQGTWFYSTNNGTTWNGLGSVALNNARLLAADPNTRLYFQASPNYNGTITDAITFAAWDQTAGTNGGLLDLTTGTNAVSTNIFFSDFSNQQTGGIAYGNASITDNKLLLTSTASGQQGNFVIASPGAALNNFTANFDLLIGGGSGADGISFNYAGDILPMGGSPEEGLGNGLSITFDTYNNGGTDGVGFEVKYNGVRIAFAPVASGVLRTNTYVPVSIQTNALGQITLTHNGAVIFNKLTIPGWAPQADWQFSLAARTGGLTDNHWVDNLRISSTSTASITVNSVNDAPDFTIGANQTIAAGATAQAITGWAQNFQANDSKQSLSGYEIVSNNRSDLFKDAITIDWFGNLRFNPVADLITGTGGVATIGVRVRDNGGTANGGMDVSAVKTFTITVNPRPLSKWSIAAEADFDRDGKADILWRNDQTGANVIWKMGANGLDSSINLTTVSDLNWQIVGTADFNGDGKTDVLWRNKVTAEINYWQMNDLIQQSAIALPTTFDPIRNTNVQIAAIADFDRDGKADLLWRNKATGQNGIWTMGNGWNGIGSINPSTLILPHSTMLTNVSIDWDIVGAADFNGDAKTDILWRNKNSGANTIWTMNGTTQLQSVNLETVADNNFQVAGIADFNGDGKVDILWRNKATGENVIWQMNGMVKQSAIILPTMIDPDFQITGVKDVNGDGKVDILWRNKRTGANTLWKMNGLTLTSADPLASVYD
jgi:hypothetical protein